MSDLSSQSCEEDSIFELSYSSDSEGYDFDGATIFKCEKREKPVCEKTPTGNGATSEGNKIHSCIMCPSCRRYYCSLKYMKPKIVRCDANSERGKNLILLCNEYLNTIHDDNELFEEDCGLYQESSFNEFGKYLESKYNVNFGIKEHEKMPKVMLKENITYTIF